MNRTYRVIGLMSGSSLDGLDVAYCYFDCKKKDGELSIENWEIRSAKTYPFSDDWKNRLRSLSTGSAFELMQAHAAFGSCMGTIVNRFLSDHHLDKSQVDFLASHGHTVFHEPEQGFTTQIGDALALATATGCTTVYDFRSADVALGGQGAPLAPMADKMLFPEYDFYLNLGGIANITCNIGGRFVAFDICGANQILNALAGELNLPYDHNGTIAARGSLDQQLFEQQYVIDFFQKDYPKSLSNQWVQENQTAVFLKNENTPENKLHTAVELTARLIAEAVFNVLQKEKFEQEKYKLLVAGGGACNGYLMQRLQSCLSPKNVSIITPPSNIIEFKEAALMALLGVMRMENTPNCMASVTGAKKDSVGGLLVQAP